MRLALLPVLALAAASCAPSPLYVQRATPGTPGEIPRDTLGQPMWGRIHPPHAERGTGVLPAASPASITPQAPVTRPFIEGGPGPG